MKYVFEFIVNIILYLIVSLYHLIWLFKLPCSFKEFKKNLNDEYNNNYN